MVELGSSKGFLKRLLKPKEHSNRLQAGGNSLLARHEQTVRGGPPRKQFIKVWSGLWLTDMSTATTEVIAARAFNRHPPEFDIRNCSLFAVPQD